MTKIYVLAKYRSAGNRSKVVEKTGPAAEEIFEQALQLEASTTAQAMVLYHLALRLDPSLVDAQINVGRLHQLRGELDSAERHYREAIMTNPNDSIPHFNLAIALEDQKRPAEAEMEYHRAIRCDNTFADAHCNLALLYLSKGSLALARRHQARYRLLSPSR